MWTTDVEATDNSDPRIMKQANAFSLFLPFCYYKGRRHRSQENLKIPETEKGSCDGSGRVKELPVAGFSLPREEEAGSGGVF